MNSVSRRHKDGLLKKTGFIYEPKWDTAEEESQYTSLMVRRTYFTKSSDT